MSKQKTQKIASPMELAQILEDAGYEVMAAGYEEAFTNTREIYAIRLLVFPGHKTLSAEQRQ